MPVDISIDKENGLVTRVIRGRVTTDEVLKSLKQVLDHPDYHQGIKSLTDLREVTPQAETVEIKKIAQLIKDQGERLKGGKAAVLVSTQITYGMMRMLQAYCDESPLEIRVFYSLDKAEAWLGISK